MSAMPPMRTASCYLFARTPPAERLPMRILDRLRRLATLLRVFPLGDVMKYRAAITAQGGPVASIRVRALKGNTVLYRPGTTDLEVLRDAFIKQYHLPPFRIRPDGVIVDLGANVGYTV